MRVGGRLTIGGHSCSRENGGEGDGLDDSVPVVVEGREVGRIVVRELLPS